MLVYLLKRILSAIPVLALLLCATFFALRLAPGGPFDGDRRFPPEIELNIQTRYGLDQPLSRQFTNWAGDVLHGDLGESFQYLGRSVGEIISATLPVSATIGSLALLLGLLLGVPLGVLAAAKRGSVWDASAMILAVSGVSLPSYLLASALILIFSLQLQWLPAALWEDWASMVLPVATLSLRPMAVIARMVRTSMIEALHSDSIRVARAKGLGTISVLFKHALTLSLIPVLTILGPLVANLVTGSFLVETVFQLPGLGKHFVSAVMNRDYPLVMGTTLVYGVLLVITNLTADVLTAWVDPRVRMEGS